MTNTNIYHKDPGSELTQAEYISNDSHSLTQLGSGGTPVDIIAGTVDTRDDIIDNQGNIIYDYSNQYIPQTALQNDSVTIEGNTVSLGNSTSVNHNDLSAISSDDHHTKYTDENAQDAINNLLVGGTNVSLSYDDAGNSLTIDGSDQDTHISVSEDGSQILSDISDVNFTDTNDAAVSVTDDGDGSVSVDVDVTDNDTTYSAGDGLTLSTTTFNIEPIDFAGSGLQDDGSDNLELVNNSITVAGNTVNLGGSTNINIEDLADVLGVSAIKMDIATNLTASSANRICIETDTGRVLYDNGSSFIEVGLSESQISLANLGSRSHSDLSDAPVNAHINNLTDIPTRSYTNLQDKPSIAYNSTIGLIDLDTKNYNNLTNKPSIAYDSTIGLTGLDSYNHNDLQNIGINDHINNLTDIPTRNHNDLNNISSNDHHTKTTTLSHDTDITDISSGDHHTKFAESDISSLNQSQMDGTEPPSQLSIYPLVHGTDTDQPSDAHHTKTTSSDIDHDLITGVSADDHHQAHIDPSDQSATGDITDDVPNVIYDYSNHYIPSSILEANSLTVAGNAVNLGSSTTIDHADLSNVSSNEHIDHSGVSISSGEGLTGGGDITAGRSIAFDINSLTEDTNPDGAADYVSSYDNSAGSHKKVLMDNLPGGGGGGVTKVTLLINEDESTMSGTTESVLSPVDKSHYFFIDSTELPLTTIRVIFEAKVGAGTGTYKFYIDGEATARLSLSTSSTAYVVKSGNFDISDLADGRHEVVVKAVNSGANTNYMRTIHSLGEE